MSNSMGLTRRQAMVGGALAAPFVKSLAAQERTITFAGYSGIVQDNYVPAVIEPFMKKTGIKVNYFGMPNSAQTMGTLRTQKAAPQIDVSVMDVTLAKAGTDEGLFEALDPAKVPALAQIDARGLPAGVMGAAWTFDSLSLLYSPEKVKPAPTSWKVLWDKQYAGQISLAGIPDIVGLGLVLIANRMAGGGDYRQGMDKGIASIAEMAPGVLTWDPRPDAFSFIINGQAMLGVGWNARAQLYSAQSQGKMAAVTPDEGSVFQINMIELTKGSKNTGPALEFIEYALGAEAQAAFGNRMFYAPTNKSAVLSADALARTAASPERMARMLDVDWLAVAKIRDAVGEQWRRKVLTAK